MSHEFRNGSADRQYLCTAEAAAYTGISASKLNKLRMARNRAVGPKFVKISGRVIYRLSDLDAWIDGHVVDGRE